MLHKKILLVDDQPINRVILKKMLSGNDYRFLEAGNGQEALEILHREKGQVSGILLDLVMPVMNGQEFLKAKGKDPLLSNIPVIVTTQSEKEEIELEVLSQGANDFLHKPYNRYIVSQRLANLIKLHETVDFVNAIERDGMTGVYTKEVFYRLATDILAAAPDKQYDILVTDVERFKLVNEMFSMSEGNRLLRYMGQNLENLVRSGRILLCGRSSGDIFLILAEHREDNNEDLVPKLQQDLDDYEIKLKLEMKIGCYRSESGMAVEVMCDRASMAASSIKGKYGCGFRVYEDSLRQSLLKEQDILGNMQAALTQGEFLVYYQPKFSIAGGQTCGAEALVRWQRPGEGLVGPDAFVPLFERNGFITAVDRYVWETVCRELAGWYQQYGEKMVPISVNVSRVDIYHPHLCRLLQELVAKYRFPIGLLHLEITESAFVANDEQLFQTILKLHEAGFVLELDDFGQGYSSLNMLSQMPIDIIKLDQNFLRRADKDQRQGQVIRSIIDLARKLGSKVVAEGVETEAQLEFLRQSCCDMGQGYLYARPLPKDQFAELLASKPLGN